MDASGFFANPADPITHERVVELGQASQSLHRGLEEVVREIAKRPADVLPTSTLLPLRDHVGRYSQALRALGVPSDRALLRLEACACEVARSHVPDVELERIITRTADWCVETYRETR